MILPIYVYGHPVLRKKSTEITMEYPGLKELIQNMFETMGHDQGVGLAAPQIGLPIRLFVIDTRGFKENYPDTPELKAVFINPVIKEEFGDDFTFNEGCLSIPDIHADVTRKSEILIAFTDENGTRQEKTFNGLIARVIQHEYDHLEGKVFIDRLSQMKKMLLKKKLTDIAVGKEKPSYKSIHS
ncbi:MAG: peptide deformylase [Bacteroidales bacterium]|jgi:peptide deformylase|nr:peptide deformylase [Bacteroidales bacterium]